MDHGLNFLHKKLLETGYKNLIKIKDKETIKFKDLNLTLFAPFVKNSFFEDNSKIGNLIDSAIVFESDNQSIFNANDNTPNNETCVELKSLFGNFDLAMMNYNNAGPYPSCFTNLTDKQKSSQNIRKTFSRNIDLSSFKFKDPDAKIFFTLCWGICFGRQE